MSAHATCQNHARVVTCSTRERGGRARVCTRLEDARDEPREPLLFQLALFVLVLDLHPLGADNVCGEAGEREATLHVLGGAAKLGDLRVAKDGLRGPGGARE